MKSSRVTGTPQVRVRALPVFSCDRWTQIERAFAGCRAVALGQGWRAAPERAFRPGSVRFGLRKGALALLAELADDDIFSDAAPFNDLTWERGDALEIFLRPEGQEAYYEFHLAPGGQQLALRFPHARAIAERLARGLTGYRRLLRPFFLPTPLRARGRVPPAGGRWRAYAEIPAARILEAGGSPTRWRFSVSRYDYTRGRARPVLSSTSPHAVPRFHRQQDWGALILPPT